MRIVIVATISLLLLSACQATPSPTMELESQPVATAIEDARLPEISGLAASYTTPNHLWAINDSGNSASIYLIDERLELEAEVPLSIRNRDWEDLESYSLNGESWVVIAESGDNLLKHENYHLYFYREQDLLADHDTPLAPNITLSYTYDDGPLNCEAIAIDTSSESILLFGKTADDTPVYRLDLPSIQASTPSQAELLARIAPYTDSAANQLINALVGVNLDATTAATISADNQTLFLLTYTDVWKLDRGVGQSWQEAFETKPVHFARHELQQAEALTIEPYSGELLVTTEELPAPVRRYSY